MDFQAKKLLVSGSGTFPGVGSSKSVNKSNGFVLTIKRPSLWNRKFVNRKNQSPEPMYSSLCVFLLLQFEKLEKQWKVTSDESQLQPEFR